MPCEPRVPGWYVDPDDSEVLRHWAGSWTTRRRPRPGWTVGHADFTIDGAMHGPVLEGPARHGAWSSAPEATRVVAPTRVRSAPTPDPGRLTPWDGPTAANLGWPRPRDRAWGPPRLVRPRRPLVALGALVIIAVLVAAATTGLAARPEPLISSAFAAQANRACAASLSESVAPSAATAAGEAAGLAAAAQRVNTLAATLTNLAGDTLSAPTVGLWLLGWSRWSVAAEGYASSLRSSSANLTSPTLEALASGARLDAAHANAFADAHGLSRCALPVNAIAAAGS
jgi:hypothetical protein